MFNSLVGSSLWNLGYWHALFLRSQCDVDARKVIWVWEAHGRIGKSFLADWLVVWRNAFLVTGGKFADISYCYDYQEYVVFDFSRAQEDKFPYRLLEEYKNLRVFCTKWQSHYKEALACHLIVFANFPPDRTKLSVDRWDVHHVDLNPIPLQLII